jgi:hypothetical protein
MPSSTRRSDPPRPIDPAGAFCRSVGGPVSPPVCQRARDTYHRRVSCATWIGTTYSIAVDVYRTAPPDPASPVQTIRPGRCSHPGRSPLSVTILGRSHSTPSDAAADATGWEIPHRTNGARVELKT